MSRPPFRPAHLYADLDPDESDLAGVPRAFVHAACGRETYLAAPTVRRYVRDPFRLEGDGTFVYCAHCRKRVRAVDCSWVETGHNVRDYFQHLIAEACLENATGWWLRALVTYTVAGAITVLIAVLALWKGTQDLRLIAWVAAVGSVLVVKLVAFAFGLKVVRYRRFVARYQRAFGERNAFRDGGTE